MPDTDEDEDGSNSKEEGEGESPSRSSHRENLETNLRKSKDCQDRGSNLDSTYVESDYSEMKGVNPVRQERGHRESKNTVILLVGYRIRIF